MKLYVTSDLHLEFGDLDLQNSHDVDVLILSGDILVARDIETASPRGVLSQAFLHRCHVRFPQVVMVLGNHEHYHGDFSKSTDIIRAAVADYDNFHVLDKQSVEINDYLFIGGTLWTDFNNRDPLTLTAAGSMMHDFKGVKHSAKGAAGGTWRFLPRDALDDHEAMLKYITRTIDHRRAQNQHSDRVIVVGHHSPSRLSTHDRYQNERMMNGCYSSHLDGFILDRPEICLWTHGHTHEDFDYEIGRTRIVCNPRGYVGYETRADFWQPKLIEL